MCLKEDFEDIYDSICFSILAYLESKTKNREIIGLSNIDVTNKEHLLILTQAVSLSTLSKKSISVVKNRKACKYIKNRFNIAVYNANKEDIGAVNIEEAVEELRSVFAPVTEDGNMILNNIYDAFWGNE